MFKLVKRFFDYICDRWLPVIFGLLMILSLISAFVGVVIFLFKWILVMIGVI